jgi:hypothetical protein
MSILSTLKRVSPKKFYAALGHRPYWQYTLGSYSGSEIWNTRFVLVTDAVSEPTIVTAKRKKSLRGGDVEVLALPDHASLTVELAQAVCGVANAHCTLRLVKIAHGQQTVGDEACLIEANGVLRWSANHLHDALHAIPRPAHAAQVEQAVQTSFEDEVLSRAGFAA